MYEYSRTITTYHNKKREKLKSMRLANATNKNNNNNNKTNPAPPSPPRPEQRTHKSRPPAAGHESPHRHLQNQNLETTTTTRTKTSVTQSSPATQTTHSRPPQYQPPFPTVRSTMVGDSPTCTSQNGRDARVYDLSPFRTAPSFRVKKLLGNSVG